VGIPEAFKRLASLRFDEESLEAVLRLVVCLATAALPGTDATDAMVLRSSGLETVGAFDNCQELDEVQSRLQRGPCLVAMREAETVDATVPATSRRWPEFAQVATEGGFGAVLALPLRTPDRVIGSLSLFSRHRQGFDDDTRVAAALLADRAAVVLANAIAFTSADLLNRHLGEALASRGLIGRAKGILMERHGCGDNGAFDRLRHESQTTHRKLRDVAKGVTESAPSTRDEPEWAHHR
jgi:GAF domain-containing protein